MDRFALQEGNWIVIIAMFAASISLAGFTSKWLVARFPGLSRFGFMLFLSVTTAYFCVIVFLMNNIT
jgi:signal recognition particle receptor subunit beta